MEEEGKEVVEGKGEETEKKEDNKEVVEEEDEEVGEERGVKG